MKVNTTINLDIEEIVDAGFQYAHWVGCSGEENVYTMYTDPPNSTKNTPTVPHILDVERGVRMLVGIDHRWDIVINLIRHPRLTPRVCDAFLQYAAFGEIRYD